MTIKRIKIEAEIYATVDLDDVNEEEKVLNGFLVGFEHEVNSSRFIESSDPDGVFSSKGWVRMHVKGYKLDERFGKLNPSPSGKKKK